jgi:hypothetical protein
MLPYKQLIGLIFREDQPQRIELLVWLQRL